MRQKHNLSGFQRAELALMIKPIEEAKAKERQLRKSADFVVQNSSQKKARDTIADLAGVFYIFLVNGKDRNERHKAAINLRCINL